MPEPTAVLRYDPERLPELRQAFTKALDTLSPKLDELQWKGRMVESWMNDPVSERVQELYNAQVMDHPQGGYHSLRAYEQELQRVHDALLVAEESYRRTEEANTELARGIA